MSDPIMWSAICGASLAGVITVSVAALKGWRDWIGLQRLSLEGMARRDEAPPLSGTSSSARIELADLRERIRKLEAIAAGVEL
jgi:hypothetical protein